MRDYELEHERGKPAARVRTRQVSRSVLDDISTWWNGEPNLKVGRAKPEKPFTRQDWDQTMSLVYMPVNTANGDMSGKQPEPAACKAAAGRLGPAAAALQVIADSKREAKNKEAILAPLPDIQSAQVSLDVMADYDNAPKIWEQAFHGAASLLDGVVALPVYDIDNQDPDNADPPPADSLTKRDHDLLEQSVKPTLQRLIETTSHVPFSTWDPTTYAEGSETLQALRSLSNPKLQPVIDAVVRGMQAIQTYSKSLEDQAKEVSGKLEAAMQKISQMQQPYMDEVEKEMAAQQEQPK
jgi:hypothetical protein